MKFIRLSKTLLRRSLSTVASRYASEVAAAGREVGKRYGLKKIGGPIRIFKEEPKLDENKDNQISETQYAQAMKDKEPFTAEDIQQNAEDLKISQNQKYGW